MQCPNCGKETSGMGLVCGSCGILVSSTTASSPETTTQPAPKSKWAVASLLLGLFPLVFVTTLVFKIEILSNLFVFIFWLAPVAGMLAVILGYQAIRTIRRSSGRLSGLGNAIVGLGLGCVILLGLLVASFLPSRNIGDGYSALARLRTINTAAPIYGTRYGRGFPSKLADLAPPDSAYTPPSEKAAGLIDRVLASGVSCFGGCYRFSYIAGPVDSDGKISTYTVHADPIKHRAESKIHYFTDQTGVIRLENDREASATSPPIWEDRAGKPGG